MYDETLVYINTNTFDIVSGIPDNEKYQDYFQCDPLIAEGISDLNKKGYKTLICCQGHVPRMSCGSLLENIKSGYVAFEEGVVLPSIPKFYYPIMLSVGDFNNCIVSDIEMNYDSSYSATDFQDRIVAQSQSFNNWAKALPQYQRTEDKSK